jgi:hypothetical protein
MYGIPGYAPKIRGIGPRTKQASKASQVNPSVDATEEFLDAALEATFPASDPLSVTQPGGSSQSSMTGGSNGNDNQRSSPGLA